MDDWLSREWADNHEVFSEQLADLLASIGAALGSAASALFDPRSSSPTTVGPCSRQRPIHRRPSQE